MSATHQIQTANWSPEIHHISDLSAKSLSSNSCMNVDLRFPISNPWKSTFTLSLSSESQHVDAFRPFQPWNASKKATHVTHCGPDTTKHQPHYQPRNRRLSNTVKGEEFAVVRHGGWKIVSGNWPNSKEQDEEGGSDTQGWRDAATSNVPAKM